MSIPYLPLYVADYDADTAHLTMEEDGIYMRLLRLCWRTPGCSVPDEKDWLMRRLRVTDEDFERVVKPVIAEFFKRSRGRLFSPRLSAEHDRVSEVSRKRSEAGKKGGRPAKSLKKAETTESPAKANEKHLELDLDRKKEREPNGSPKKGSRLPAEWVLPRTWGEWAVEQGLSVETVRRQGEMFRDYWIAQSGAKAVKLDWQATWRNWIRSHLSRNAPRVIPQSDFWAGGKVFQ